ncbi:MAG TPA: c-type cytochrome [Vicinamibacterales bacterium]|nr:c-type cytochrome [Vicinamibacterales bacterium]
MRAIGLLLIGGVIGVAAVAGAGLVYLRSTGLSTRAEAGSVEVSMARRARSFAIPARARELQNPIPVSPEALADGMAHYADHCASCHANDGSGKTEMGQGLFPKAPDMRLAPTQQMSDGELFYVIEDGIRFTGMPAWSTGTSEGEESTWRLVHFLRRLPDLTEAELAAMKERNPRSPQEIRLEIEEERFLNQGVP